MRDSWKDLTTDLVAVCLWSQPLVQRTHLSRQMLESIPEFSLLVREKKNMGRVSMGRFVPSKELR